MTLNGGRREMTELLDQRKHQKLRGKWDFNKER